MTQPSLFAFFPPFDGICVLTTLALIALAVAALLGRGKAETLDTPVKRFPWGWIALSLTLFALVFVVCAPDRPLVRSGPRRALQRKVTRREKLSSTLRRGGPGKTRRRIPGSGLHTSHDLERPSALNIAIAICGPSWCPKRYFPGTT